jgi:2-dehydropantoate 2-reductase
VHPRWIDLGARGAREALAVTAAAVGKRPSIGARMMARPRVLRFALWFGRRVMPLPLEIYLREHFTKVHAQTIEFMTSYVENGKRAGLDVSALEGLLAGVKPRHVLEAARPVA